MSKKKMYICFASVILIALLAVGILMLRMPCAPLGDPQRLEITNVYKVVDSQETDVTDNVDLDTLSRLLTMLRSERLPTAGSTHLMADTTYEIDGVYDNRAMHIVLGKPEMSCIYEAANYGCYKIENSEAWNVLIELLIEK